MSKFWDKVRECKHKNLWPCYSAYVSCGTPYCSGHEYHCKDCKAYVTECGCGFCNGLSGWPWSRVKKKTKYHYANS